MSEHERTPLWVHVLGASALAAVVLVQMRSRKVSPPIAPTPAPSASLAEVNVAAQTLRFRVLTTHSEQRVLDAAPWHEPGGDWTFHDAELPDGTRFTFGTRFRNGTGIVFGKVLLTVPDADAGARLVKSVAQLLHAADPKELPRQPLRFLPVTAALIGEGMKRDPNAFVVGGGNWTGTKLFLPRGSSEGEVYLNFDAKAGMGELAEKDPKYAETVVGVLAAMLRDGPRAARTPETDPSLSAIGPKLGAPVKLPGSHTKGGAPDGKSLWTVTEDPKAGTIVHATVLDHPKVGATNELLRIDGRLGRIACTASMCLVEDERPKQWNVYAWWEDPTTVVRIDRATGTKLPIEGPWETRGGISDAFGGSGQWIALTEWRTGADGGRTRYLHFVELAPNAKPRVARSIEYGGSPAEVLRFEGTGAALAAVVRIGGFGQNQRFEHVELQTGQTSVVNEPAPDHDLSPDGSTRMSCREHEAIDLEDLVTKTKRTFTFHPDDRASVGETCGHWLHPRYIEVYLDRMAFLDVKTMKLSYGAPLGENDWSVSADFRWATRTHDGALWIAPILLPAE